MITFAQVPVWLLAARFTGKRINCGVRAQLRNQAFIVAPIVTTAVSTAGLWWWLGSNTVVYAVVVAIVCPLVYVAVLRLTAPGRLLEVLTVIRQALGKGSPQGG
jgi:hypothetical protein